MLGKRNPILLTSIVGRQCVNGFLKKVLLDPLVNFREWAALAGEMVLSFMEGLGMACTKSLFVCC